MITNVLPPFFMIHSVLLERVDYVDCVSSFSTAHVLFVLKVKSISSFGQSQKIEIHESVL